MCDRALEQQAAEMAALLPQIMRRLNQIDDQDPTIELPLAQLRVCNLLRDGSRPVCDLSRDLGTSASAITQMADRLERAGLVERVTEGDDRRVKRLRLTESGERIIFARQARRVRRITEVLAHLEPSDREGVLISLEKLLHASLASSWKTHEDLLP